MQDSSYESENAFKSSKPFKEFNSQCGKDVTMRVEVQGTACPQGDCAGASALLRTLMG